MPPRRDGSIQRMEGARDGLLAALRVGASLSEASRTVGVPERTVQNWIARGGREPDGPFGAFAAEVSAAREVRAGPMEVDELREVAAKAARKGSVQAMRLIWAMQPDQALAPTKPKGSLAALDELAAKRRRRTRGDVS